MAADLGSGLLDERVPWVAGAPPGWLAGEPGARQIIDSGADVVLFSGDKLLGGPQAGIIAGSSDTVGALRSHPLARAVRIGGSPLAALTATLSLYAGGRGAEIPFWAMALTSAEDLERRCAALIITSGGEIAPGESVLGGGSAPGAAIRGPVVRIACRAEAARLSLLRADPPVIARVDSGHLVVDLRTVGQSDDEYLAEALAKACR
jgi:L-seryl-tRNA(Ser) seleniumtransferase